MFRLAQRDMGVSCSTELACLPRFCMKRFMCKQQEKESRLVGHYPFELDVRVVCLPGGNINPINNDY